MVMGKAKLSKPLIFQSKLLCVSLLYLVTTLFLALYTSINPTKCLFRSSPFDPVQTPFFSYPSSYGEHKYVIPTHRSSCSSPIYFSDYWMVLNEILHLCQNSSVSSHALREEVPCGFFKRFPISDPDRMAMESCHGVVVVSAIFNDHDKIRQPKSLGSKTRDNVCFFMFVDDVTLKRLDHHEIISRNSSHEYNVGVWRIIKVSSKDHLYDNPAMNGMIPKHLAHRLFPNSKFSIWVDAKLQLMVDPLILIHALVVSEKVDMAVSKHPFFTQTMEEALATARWKKWKDVDGLRNQMETYCENGLQPWTPKKPYPSDVPDSALILRKHGLNNNLFSCLLFNELEAFNPRDQLPFSYVRDHMKPKLRLNMFEVEVFEQVAVEYRHNLKKDGTTAGEISSLKRTKRVADDLFINSSCCSKCHNYLLEMWGESHD
ncbi:ALKALINE CERAMIDASE-RELATED [Salix viminalis]|uniref:ALKALINE CERAMIDASE-RELATED n=1 Tax=Salix viminalis TaxID=40686 RepID=A0A9Q0NP57_SALVM|nr:ALKALINE CERAMIDASE-RELATED [Salix viminalis]